MEYVTLGRTNLMVSRSAFGTRLLQNISMEDSSKILNVAYDSGINFFDTSSSYFTVEEKLSNFFNSEVEQNLSQALNDKRKNSIISSGSKALLGKDVCIDVENSLRNLNTDFIDIYHITSDNHLPIPGTDDGLYNEMLKARRDGKIRFIGFTTHKLALAKEALESGLYDVIRYPLNIFSSEDELSLIAQAEKLDVGICAIKTLASGKIENVPLAFGFLRQYENLVSVWGARNIDEIQKLIYFELNPPNINEQFNSELQELKNNFNSEN